MKGGSHEKRVNSGSFSGRVDEQIKGKRPGVLVVREVWGLNDYARKRARMLTELGYTALAVDMYGDGKVVTNFDEASKLYSEVMKNFDVAKVRFLAAMDFLKQQPTVDPTRIAAIGYCFGGFLREDFQGIRGRDTGSPIWRGRQFTKA